MNRIFQTQRKAILITTFIIALSMTNSFAQQFHIGAKAGLAATDITAVFSPGSSVQDPTNVAFGFHGGLILDIAFNDRFSIAPELLYTTAGAKQNIDQKFSYSFLGSDFSTSLTGSTKIGLGYFQAPILLKYRCDNGLIFSVGPTIGYLLSNKIVNSTVLKTSVTTSGVTTSASYPTDSTYKMDSAFKKMDMGFAMGVGYQFEGGFGFGIRYIFGFSDIFKGDVTYPDANSPYPRNITQGSYGKNEIFQFSVSYIFGLNK